MSMRNGGFNQDDEDVKEQNGFHVDTVEWTWLLGSRYICQY
jgi:hypothetical protein